MAVRMQINLTAGSRSNVALCNVKNGTVSYHAGQYEDNVFLRCESVQFGCQVQAECDSTLKTEDAVLLRMSVRT
jgi:hypothetical protein